MAALVVAATMIARRMCSVQAIDPAAVSGNGSRGNDLERELVP